MKKRLRKKQAKRGLAEQLLRAWKLEPGLVRKVKVTFGSRP